MPNCLGGGEPGVERGEHGQAEQDHERRQQHVGRHDVVVALAVDLNLAGTALDDAGLKAIGALPAATHLRLARNRLTDGALADLAALPALAYLNLYGNAGITDSGIAALAASRTLRELFVWQTAVSPDGAARLREQRPGLVVDLGTAATAAQ